MFFSFTKKTNTSKKDASREIERKFLVKRMPPDLKKFPHDLIEQGYLAASRGGFQVRLRKKGSVLSLTFKQGTKGEREEREIRLSLEQFKTLWPATAGRRLTKVRYDVPWKKHTIEIDVYRGRHDGLVVAEVEFDDQESCANFEPPAWLGRDVTGKPKYSNVAMAHD
ncbi:MAG TPA: CYTH domain-containing protein [Chthoniobacterales bacterium]|nr:CYTH domain-containing protein [Chthoniobacterales bacterium]